MGPVPRNDVESAASAFERWEWQERQAKFIVNSVRVYEAFGHEWRLPWWDASLMDFWSMIPVHMRARRALFLRYMERRHRLPVPQANVDRGTLASAGVRLIDHLGLRPTAMRIRRRLQHLQWKRLYEHDPMSWFALVDIDSFRRRYTGREIGHSFFADMYIDSLTRQ